MSSDTVRVSEWILKTDNRSAIRGLKEIADTGDETTRSLKANSDEDEASLAKVGESAGRLRDSMMGLAGMIGLGGVAFGLKDVVEGGMALQTAQIQLQQALRDTGQTADGAASHLEKMAESMSTHGGFATTENLGALTQFVRETHSAARAQSMLTLATNIARGTGQSLSTTVADVAKAYTGQARSLQSLLGPMIAHREAVVGLTVAHQREIAALQNQAAMMGPMGSVFMRQAEINDHLTAQQVAAAQLTDKHATAMMVLTAATKEFGGATQRYMGGNAGRLSDLKNSFHNLTDELGLGLLPAINWIVARGAAMANWMSKNKEVVLGLVGAIGAFGAVQGIKKVAESVTGLAGDLTKLATRFGIVGVAGEEAGAEAAAGGEAATISWDTFFRVTLIGAGITALIEIADHWRFFEGLVVGVWNAISGAVVGAWDWIKRTVSEGVDWIWNKIKWLGDEARRLISDTPLGGLFGFGSSLLSGHIGRAFGDLAQGVTGGAYQANTGTFGVPGRNLWQGSAQQHHTTVQVTPTVARVNIDGREIANAAIRYTLNRAARGPSNLVGGSLVTGSTGY